MREKSMQTNNVPATRINGRALAFGLLLGLTLSSSSVFANKSGGEPEEEFSPPAANAVAEGNAAAGPLIGSYQVHSGPEWATDPPTYTCLEACAMVFGGAPDDYACSTNGVTVNNLAWASTWGTPQHCDAPAGPGDDPVAEDFKLSDTYDCGDTGCSVSAYVKDHCAVDFGGPGDSENFCFSAEPPDPVPSLNTWGLAILAAAVLLLAGFSVRRRMA